MKLHNLYIVAIVLIAIFAVSANAQTLGSISVTHSTMDSVKIEFSHLYPTGVPQGEWCLRVRFWSNDPNAKFRLQWPVNHIPWTNDFRYKLWKTGTSPNVTAVTRPILIKDDSISVTEGGDLLSSVDAWLTGGSDFLFDLVLSSIDTAGLEVGFFGGESGYVEFYIDDFNARYSGQPTLIQSFGDYGSISGNVNFDTDNDSSYGGGDYGLEDWLVRLLRDDGMGGLLIDSTYTDSAGSFTFSGPMVDQGSYLVTTQLKACWQQTWPCTPDTHHVTISTTNLDTTVSFGAYVSGLGFYNYHARWNLVALPRNPCEFGVQQVFPDALTPAYSYDAGNGGGYGATNFLSFGIGYWIKMNGAHTVPIVGDSMVSGYFQLYPGWNLVGMITSPMLPSQITTEPPGVIQGPLYTFSSTGGYYAADTLFPGKAYWVKAETTATMAVVYTGQSASRAVLRQTPTVGALNSLTIADAAGNSRVLYFGNQIENLGYFDLPPLPPQGAFDARFNSHRSVEVIADGGNTSIMLQGEYPFTVHYNVSGPWLLSGQLISGSGTLVVHREGSLTLSQDGATIPATFALEQNYPNPFNPTTTIKFSVPTKEHVTLKVFNVIGQEVATLISEVREAGSHEVTWNANGTPSGVYFYRLQAGTRTASQKMLLMK